MALHCNEGLPFSLNAINITVCALRFAPLTAENYTGSLCGFEPVADQVHVADL